VIVAFTLLCAAGWWFGSQWLDRLPYWTLHAIGAVVCGVPLTVIVVQWYKESVSLSREERGHCASCGYDLRATPGKCPECGTVPKTSN
jgi:hypothetical protein